MSEGSRCSSGRRSEGRATHSPISQSLSRSRRELAHLARRLGTAMDDDVDDVDDVDVDDARDVDEEDCPQPTVSSALLALTSQVWIALPLS